jgi:hypothetical protein
LLFANPIFYITAYYLKKLNLQTKLGTTPVTSLGIVLDGIVELETAPLRKWAVLLRGLGKSALGAEGLLGRLAGEKGRNQKW